MSHDITAVALFCRKYASAGRDRASTFEGGLSQDKKFYDGLVVQTREKLGAQVTSCWGHLFSQVRFLLSDVSKHVFTTSRNALVQVKLSFAPSASTPPGCARRLVLPTLLWNPSIEHSSSWLEWCATHHQQS